MNNVAVSKKSLNEIVENINKNFKKKIVSVSLDDGQYKVTVLGYGQRFCPTLLETITFVQGVGVGIIIKDTIGKLK